MIGEVLRVCFEVGALVISEGTTAGVLWWVFCVCCVKVGTRPLSMQLLYISFNIVMGSLPF